MHSRLTGRRLRRQKRHDGRYWLSRWHFVRGCCARRREQAQHRAWNNTLLLDELLCGDARRAYDEAVLLGCLLATEV